MKKEIKAKWIAALRSGDYKQGMDQLRYEDEFCCLGVLCDIHKKETGKGSWSEETGNSFCYMNDTDYDATNLPEFVKNWAGLKHGKVDFLIHLNDTGSSFGIIADNIELTF